MKQIYLVLVLALASFMSLSSQTSELEVGSSIDNTIFEDLVLSNGLGEYIFAGTTNDDVTKRALVQFDLTDALPPGIPADSALLILVPVKVKPVSTVVSAYRLTAEWGEGTSRAEDGDGKGALATVGDATWSHAKYPTNPWIKNGGDYDLDFSATATVSVGNKAIFRSERLTLDVNFWLQNPSDNFGWILIGDETTTATSAKFGSRDHTDPAQWPILRLFYQGTNSVSQQINPASRLTVYQATDPQSILIENPHKSGSSKVEIFSVTGTLVLSTRTELSAGKNQLFTGDLETGIYLYRISLNGTSNSGKLLITDR